MSAVAPGAFSMIWLRYLPRPSCVMPRSTGTPRCGASVNVSVLLGSVKIASERSLPTLLHVDVEGGHEVEVADVVVAQQRVHDAGDLLALLGVAVEVHALHQRGGAVAHSDNRDVDLAHGGCPSRLACGSRARPAAGELAARSCRVEAASSPT